MNTPDELRKMAENLLMEHPREHCVDKWDGSIKTLLHELNICRLELELQNKELEHTERLLAEAYEEYVQLFESTPIGYLILDEDHNIIKVNQTFVSSFVCTNAQALQLEGSHFDEFVAVEFKKPFAVFCKMAQTKKVPISMDLKLNGRHGDSCYVMLSARSYDLEKKSITMTVSDISMQKSMEAQLVKVKSNETNLNRLKSRFLTNVSQDLRAPLATIVSYKEIMNDPIISDAEKIIFCQEIIPTAEMLQLFLGRICDASALENDEVTIHSQAVDMEKLCNSVVPLLSRNLRQKNVQLNIHATGIPMIWSDPLRLKQIICSVLEHVIGNVSNREIVLTCSHSAGYDLSGTLSLTFSGDDIFSSEYDYVKNSDFSLQSGRRDSINLLITDRIVNAMKGKMVWEHSLNSLRIEIPIILSSKGKAADQDDKIFVHHLEPSRSKTCLLVDDVSMNLKILGTMMKQLGYTPTLASSGREAQNLINEHHFDIVMTDLWMPEISGEDLAIVLRQNPDYDDVPIYAVTADVEFGSNFDMDFFTDTIIKPISLERLRMIIMALEKKTKT